MIKNNAILLFVVSFVLISDFSPMGFASEEGKGVVINSRAGIAKIMAGDSQRLADDSGVASDDSLPVEKSDHPVPVIGAKPVRQVVTVGAAPYVNRGTVGAMPVSAQPVVGKAIGMQSPAMVTKGDGVPQDSETDIPAEDKLGSDEAF
jgi:hypothetical protein